MVLLKWPALTTARTEEEYAYKRDGQNLKAKSNSKHSHLENLKKKKKSPISFKFLKWHNTDLHTSTVGLIKINHTAISTLLYVI